MYRSLKGCRDLKLQSMSEVASRLRTAEAQEIRMSTEGAAELRLLQRTITLLVQESK